MKNPTRVLIKKNPPIPICFDSKDKKIENNFTIEEAQILIDFEDLEGIFTLEIYEEDVLKMRLNKIILTTVNEVKEIIEGYAKSIESF